MVVKVTGVLRQASRKEIKSTNELMLTSQLSNNCLFLG